MRLRHLWLLAATAPGSAPAADPPPARTFGPVLTAGDW